MVIFCILNFWPSCRVNNKEKGLHKVTGQENRVIRVKPGLLEIFGQDLLFEIHSQTERSLSDGSCQ